MLDTAFSNSTVHIYSRGCYSLTDMNTNGLTYPLYYLFLFVCFCFGTILSDAHGSILVVSEIQTTIINMKTNASPVVLTLQPHTVI